MVFILLSVSFKTYQSPVIYTKTIKSRTPILHLPIEAHAVSDLKEKIVLDVSIEFGKGCNPHEKQNEISQTGTWNKINRTVVGMSIPHQRYHNAT